MVVFRKTSAIVFALVVLGAAFFGGAFFGYSQRPAVEKVLNVFGKEQPLEFANVDFNLFWDVWNRIEEKYVDREDIDRQELVFGAIGGLVGALKDPYSQFLPPPEAKQFQEDIKGEFGGIGAEIGIRRGVLTIISPLKDSPAEKAGLKPGDQILQVDDTLTAELTLNESVQIIRGEVGTPVVLTIFRNTFDKAREITVVRDKIKIPVLETEQKEDGIFVIRLYHFAETAPSEFQKAVQKFFESGSRKLILDVRNNPGGFLQVAVDIASWFLPAGEVVAREKFGDGSEELYRSRGYQFLANIPTVILVNEGSASASEIVAGALRDLKGIKLVGKKTFGKGSVQEVQNLKAGSSLKITIAKWLTPNGSQIEGEGLEPDIDVEFPEDEKEIQKLIDEDRDLIMEKGIEVLKEL